MSAKILIVDDDPVNLKVVEHVLSDEGYELLEAESGPEALALAEAHRPDLMVLDVMMPEMNGFEVCQRVRSNPAIANLLIILLTARSSVESRIQGFEAGADDFMAKPFHPAELQAHVQALLRRSAVAEQQVLRPPIVGKMIAFFSLRGGVGISSLSVNVAVALSQLWSKPTALIDLALTCGQSALALNQTLRHTWADLASIPTDECTIELVEQAMLDHESGVRTLAAPSSSEMAELVDAPTVERVLTLLSGRYEYIVLDLPHNFQETTLVALDRSDRIVVVLAPDIGSVYAAKRALDTFRMLDYPEERVSLMLNWTFEKRGLARKSIESALGVPVTHIFPYAGSLLVEALNRGTPATTYFEGRPLAAFFEDLAFEMSSEDDRTHQPTSPTATWKRVTARHKDRPIPE